MEKTKAENIDDIELEHLHLHIPYEGETFPSNSKKTMIQQIGQSCKSELEKKKEIEEVDKKIRNFVDNMIDVVEAMRKGHFYIHCDNGTTVGAKPKIGEGKCI